MPARTFTQGLVEHFAPMVAERLWSGSCPITPRPLFRELPPTIQMAWAREAQSRGAFDLALSDDPDLPRRTAEAVAAVWDDIKPDD